MSLIADALKAAQQEKSKRIPAPAAAGGGFFAVRGGSRSQDGLPRPLVYALVAVGAVGLVAALVTLLLSSAKPNAKPVTTPPPAVTQPPIAPAEGAAIVNPVPAPVLTDSASSVPAATANATSPTVAIIPSMQPPSATLGATTMPPRTAADSARLASPARDTAAAFAAAPKPAGTLKITMEEAPATDLRPLFQQALAAQRRGDVNRAKELYARALDRDPQNADLYNNIGMLYRNTGELDRAEDAYRHAISLNPKLAAAWSNLGVLLDARGRRKEAIAALQQAIAVDPTNVGVKVNLALQYHASGLYADARRLLEEAVKASPTMPEAQYALARTLEALGDRSGAIQHYDLFLRTSNGRFPQLERQVTQHLATLRAGS